ncbi:UNVERIFIED_CONTAM: hypothetical protein Sindi_0228700 [Sesamum indicum]
MQEFNESQRTNSTENRKIKIQGGLEYEPTFLFLFLLCRVCNCEYIVPHGFMAPVPLQLLGKMKKMALSLYPQDAEVFSSWDIAGKPVSTIIHLWPSKTLKVDIRSKDCDWKSTYLREMAFRITPDAIEDDLKSQHKSFS